MYCKDTIALEKNLTNLNNGIAIIYAAEKGFDFLELQKIIQQSSIPVVGAFFPGLISEGALHYSGYILQHIDSPYQLIISDSKIKNPELSKGSITKGTGLILMDGLADSNQSFLNSIFYELGHSFKFIGSGAGSLDLVQKPCLFDKDGIYEDKVILILLEDEVAIGLKHGYDRIAGPFVATSTTKSRIMELNWENAYDSYAQIVNNDSSVPISKEDFFSISKGYPLGISRKGHEDIVRDPISVDEEGVLNCLDDIPENVALYILKGEPQKLISAAKSSCQQALNAVSGKPKSCLLIDCISRVLYLGDNFDKELLAATEEIHSAYPTITVEGILSMGEISTFQDGRLELYNKTFLATMLYA